MKTLNTLFLAASTTSLAVASVIDVPVMARLGGNSVNKRNDMSDVELVNEKIGYFAEIDVGTPAQKVDVLLDTGSSDLWVYDSQSNMDSTFSPDKSSSFSQLDDEFHATFSQGQLKVDGKFGKDSVGFGNYKVKDQQFAVVSHQTEAPASVFGVAPQGSENTPNKYSNFPQALKDQGVIKRNVYSLFLNSLDASTGSLLFGGIDKEKFVGSLAHIPMSNTSWFRVPGEIGMVGGTFHAELDTGSAFNYLPKEMLDAIANYTKAEYDAQADSYFYSEKPQQKLTFQIGGAAIEVPPEEYTITAQNKLTLAMKPTQSGPNTLGLPFLRSAYVVFDNDKRTISIAPSSFSDKSDIVEYD